MVPVTPASMDEWREEIARRQSLRAQLADELAESKRVAIEKAVMAGVTVYHVTPPTIDPRLEQALFVYLHGGAYVYGGGPGNVFEAVLIAEKIGIRAMSIDFRMPPDHPAPQAVEDVVAVFSAIIEDHDASQVVLGGASSGGGLTLASVQRLIELKLPVPAALYAGTPWADLTETSDSLHVNRNVDRVLRNYDGLLQAGAKLYAGNMDMKDPRISPVYGDFSGFPPTWIVTGTRDILLSDSVRVHRKMRRAGVNADLNVFEGMSHGGYLRSPDSPETEEVYAGLKRFLLKSLADNQ